MPITPHATLQLQIDNRRLLPRLPAFDNAILILICSSRPIDLSETPLATFLIADCYEALEGRKIAGQQYRSAVTIASSHPEPQFFAF